MPNPPHIVVLQVLDQKADAVPLQKQHLFCRQRHLADSMPTEAQWRTSLVSSVVRVYKDNIMFEPTDIVHWHWFFQWIVTDYLMSSSSLRKHDYTYIPAHVNPESWLYVTAHSRQHLKIWSTTAFLFVASVQSKISHKLHCFSYTTPPTKLFGSW